MIAADSHGADLSAARDRLRASLPETLHRALDAYDTFAARPVPEDAKEFAAWQGGCKAALAHVELLLKLAGRVGLDLSDPGAGEGDALAGLLAQARAAVGEGGDDDREDDADD
ncbi:hypothetical protein [Roseospira navarrensis]|uniref:Uncharacterized protein n=1 Tax=Roseospira navarrensis TaxID=140058 RepID=A0A7X2D3S3_9PROT|nr:hypothetical protein [Roseospira navarrensis]MQX35470.1 hypothetical protein [Roseospira navarrensis]